MESRGKVCVAHLWGRAWLWPVCPSMARLAFRCQIILMLDVLGLVRGEKLLIRRRMCFVSGAP